MEFVLCCCVWCNGCNGDDADDDAGKDDALIWRWPDADDADGGGVSASANTLPTHICDAQKTLAKHNRFFVSCECGKYGTQKLPTKNTERAKKTQINERHIDILLRFSTFNLY